MRPLSAAGLVLLAVWVTPVSASGGGLRGVVFPEEALASEDAAAPRRLMLPPWWILHGVKPDGPPQDMGGWTAITFSKEQKRHFGINASGEVVDQQRYNAALKALKSKSGEDNQYKSSPQLLEQGLVDPMQRNLNLEYA
mmetsp:Transcript_86060/g.233561  ORF Transcript_86060/g.233561 Transcript_86060/m.233561 type:complete len:139 (-) Transcript_86060:59-475(-)